MTVGGKAPTIGALPYTIFGALPQTSLLVPEMSC